MKKQLIEKSNEMIFRGFYITYDVYKIGNRKHTKIQDVKKRINGQLRPIWFKKERTLINMERALDKDLKLNGDTLMDKIKNVVDDYYLIVAYERPYER